MSCSYQIGGFINSSTQANNLKIIWIALLSEPIAIFVVIMCLSQQTVRAPLFPEFPPVALLLVAIVLVIFGLMLPGQVLRSFSRQSATEFSLDKFKVTAHTATIVQFAIFSSIAVLGLLTWLFSNNLDISINMIGLAELTLLSQHPNLEKFRKYLPRELAHLKF